METFIVIGAYQFLGYYLTQYLLNRGEEVIGVDWDDGQDPFILEEKELEMGRNANFMHIPLNKLALLDISGETTIYLSYYDMRKMSEDPVGLLKNLEVCMKKHIGKIQQDMPKIFVLMPIETEEEEERQVSSAISRDGKVVNVYLPTIYGPWQPETMSFEAGLCRYEEKRLCETLANEYTGDAIYVKDLIEAFDSIVVPGEKEIQVVSSIEDHWGKCANLIFPPEILEACNGKRNEPKVIGTRVEVPCPTTPAEGVEQQKEHSKKYRLLKKWKTRDEKT